MKFTKLLSFTLFLSLIIISCNNNSETDNQQTNDSTSTVNNNQGEALNLKTNFEIETDTRTICGDTIRINFEVTDSVVVDSLILRVNQEKIVSFDTNKFNFNYKTNSETVGTQLLEIIVFSDEKQWSFDKKIVLLSDIEPVQRTYKKIKIFPHDKNAYTQGLVISKGVLYEATGLETKSTLRKVDLQTGDILHGITLSNNIFGEGITVFDNQIIQVTWQDHIGYVYDINTFQIISEFNYSTEGWGLTSDENFLYMSDGTNTIHVFDPNTYTVINKFHVYDNKGPIYYLNELEYINGFIYANIYTEDYIVKIEPESGKVIEKIDLSGILPSNLRTKNTDVLNGIAYDKINDKLYVTGKNWQQLYEIEIK